MTKLSPAERAILINQFKILGAVEGKPHAYQAEIDVLSCGYELDYKDHIDGLSEPLSEAECKFVEDILWVYALIKNAKNADAIDAGGGDRDERGRLRMENLEPKFPGFNKNKQPKYLSYAKHLIETDGKYIEHNHYLNSHGREPDYKKIIERWEGWDAPATITVAQADELLAIG